MIKYLFVSLLINFCIVTIAASSSVNKFVGIQYSVWFDSIKYRDCNNPWLDIPTVLYPDSVAMHGFRYWGMPARGTYLSTDSVIINQHADELSHMGIDFIYIDLSNLLDKCHLDATKKLLSTYKIRTQKSPKVVFLVRKEDSVKLYNEFYASALYSDQFFYYENKPLLLSGGGCLDDEVTKRNFTCRSIWGLLGNGQNWSFLELAPQSYYPRNLWPEAMPVSPAQQSDYMNSNTARGRKYNFLTGKNDGVEGQNYKDQWARAYDINPTFILIKSYNEWVAQKACLYNPLPNSVFYKYKDWLIDENCAACAGKINEELVECEKQHLSCLSKNNHDLKIDIARSLAECNRGESDSLSRNYRFTDEYNREFSTDIEPMGEPRCMSNENDCSSHGNLYVNLTQAYVEKFKSTAVNLIIRDASTGVWHFKFGRKGSVFTGENFTSTFGWAKGTHYQPIIGDFNNDGKTDIGLRDATTGRWYFAFPDSNGSFNNTRNFDWAAGSHYQPFVGDFNNDNKTDIGLRDVISGIWYFAFYDGMNNYFNTKNFSWASGSNYQPYVGNFNSDKFLDIGLRDISIGRFYFAINDSKGNYHNSRNFDWVIGQHYQAFSGDFNCDNKSDIGLFDSLTGKIHLANFDGNANYHNEHNYKWHPGASLSVFVSNEGCDL